MLQHLVGRLKARVRQLMDALLRQLVLTLIRPCLEPTAVAGRVVAMVHVLTARLGAAPAHL